MMGTIMGMRCYNILIAIPIVATFRTKEVCKSPSINVGFDEVLISVLACELRNDDFVEWFVLVRT